MTTAVSQSYEINAVSATSRRAKALADASNKERARL